ncbi:MAG: hypothetical protein K0R51_1143 [Cytophagaceae bacterium]|nr:hypothetical protein [Cytophagaceae bacterium]
MRTQQISVFLLLLYGRHLIKLTLNFQERCILRNIILFLYKKNVP